MFYNPLPSESKINIFFPKLLARYKVGLDDRATQQSLDDVELPCGVRLRFSIQPAPLVNEFPILVRDIMFGKLLVICHCEWNEVERRNRQVFAITSLRDRSVPFGKQAT
ncbi:hypothetical protein [Nostoc sp. PCC 7107]|uniref:hypothetical protein n=1 Tax=Nostoc sp. PCC 7107 TaxID=317936 RepID=UPI0012FC4236|nr:hypothetical protein [Nostoc sp. PCC 7107]